MSEDFSPNWGEETSPEVPLGVYIWTIKVWEVEMPRPASEKPYVNIFFWVEGGEFHGFKNSFRLYITPAAKNWALWFLKKFNYPSELLENQPVIRKSAFIGLTGKIQVEVTDDQIYGRKIDVKGFERLGEMDLEKKLEPQNELLFPQQDEPVIDVNADMKEEHEDLSFLDREETSDAFQATDEDLPDMFFEEPPHE